MSRVTLVKLGGSVVTHKRRPRTVRRANLARLANELAEVIAGSRRRWLIGHGSGSFGHVAAARSGIQRGVENAAARAAAAATQRQAAELHGQVIEALQAAGVPAFSVAPSSCVVTRAGAPEHVAIEPVLGALATGLVPVTYGDVVVDSVRGVAICSTETALRAFARALLGHGVGIGDAFWFGDTAGIYDADGRTIPRLDGARAAALMGAVGPSAATDVTGGMGHRLETAIALARDGIRSHIVDGLEPGVVTSALRGRAYGGTRLDP